MATEDRSFVNAGPREDRWFARSRHLWLVVLLTLPAMLPLFAPGYFLKAHDAPHSIFFLIEFDSAFRAGALWPVWAPDQAVGFGYPTFLLYAPLAYFIGEAFHLLGLGFAAAIKATWALGFLLGGVGLYRLARRWFSPAASLVASLAFTYAPYHLLQIYVRSALAEFMALAWLPWAILALLALWEDPRPRRAALAGLALAALALLHTVSTLLFAPLVGGMLVVLAVREVLVGRSGGQGVRWPAFGWTFAALVLAFLLASIFLVPMLLERGYVAQWQWVKETYDYRLHFVYPAQFLDPGWGYGYSVAGIDDGMSFQLGLLPLLLAALGGAAALRRGEVPAAPRWLALFLLLTTVLALFMMTPAAAGMWDVLPLVDLIQFPWRLLAVSAFALALLAPFGVASLTGGQDAGDEKGGRPWAWVIAIVIVLVSLPFVSPEIVPLRPQDELPVSIIEFELTYSDMRGMTRWAERPPLNEDSPLIGQYLAGQPLQRAAILSGDGEILAQEAGARSVVARVRAPGPVELLFYTYYFPGWRAAVDGRPVEIQPSGPNGLIMLRLPPGEHDVRLTFGATPPRTMGAILSGVGVLGVVALLIGDRRRRITRPGVNLR